MCWAKRCCFFIKLDLGCFLIGVMSYIFSTAMTISSIVYLASGIEEDHQQLKTNSTHSRSLSNPHQLRIFLTIELSLQTLKIILFSALVMGIMLNLASILLMVGLWKKKPGFVLFYFGVGIFFTIFSQLGALLLLLQNHWMPSLIIFITCPLYVHFLVVVHTIYEEMQKTMHEFISQERLIGDDVTSISPDTVTSTSTI